MHRSLRGASCLSRLLLSILITSEVALAERQPSDRPADATSVMAIEGKLVAASGEPITDGTIDLNGQTATLSGEVNFSIKLGSASSYTITCRAEGYYPSIHTFSEQELRTTKGQIPPIALTKRLPGRVMLAFGGDTMMGRRFRDPFPNEPQWIHAGSELEDSKALLQRIKPYTELADYTSVNLECPLLVEAPDVKSSKSYTFFSHPKTLDALAWAGVDYVSLGNNHTADYLDKGLEATLEAFRHSPIAYSGAGLDEKSALVPHRQDLLDVPYSFLGYVGWKGSFTPNQVAEGTGKGGAAYGDQENIVAGVSAEEAAGRSVVVQYHGGSEYSYAPSDSTKARLRAAIDHGADLVIAHHPHVVQGFEVYQGKLIAYSLGNFLFDQYRYETQRSAMLYVWMDGDRFHRAEIVPIDINAYHVGPATGPIRNYVLRRLRHQSESLGVQLSVSGGHAVISEADAQKAATTTDDDESQTASGIRDLDHAWYETPALAEAESSTMRYGRDVLLLGDFEESRVREGTDPLWSYSADGSGRTTVAPYEGRYALRLAAGTRSNASRATQKYFLRLIDADPAQPMSVTGYARADKPTNLKVSVELWPADWGRSRAFREPVVREVGTVRVKEGAWRQFHLTFDLGKELPLKGYKLRLANETENEPVSLIVDNLALVTWGDSVSETTPSERQQEVTRADYVWRTPSPPENALPANHSD